MKFRFLVLTACALTCSVTGCKQGMDYPYKTSPNGLKYHFFHESGGQPGQINDIYTFNATFYTVSDSIYLQKEVRFLRTPVTYRGDFQEALAMLRVGDSAVFQLAADSFYNNLDQKLPSFFKPGDHLTLKVGVKSIQSNFGFKRQILEDEIRDMNDFIQRKKWNVILDTASRIRYEITRSNPEGRPVETGDTVDLSSLFWYTIKEKIITKGKDNDKWTIVVGDSAIQTPGLSTTLTFMREGESVRTILPFTQAFGEEGNVFVDPFTTICIEFEVAGLRKKKLIE